MDAEVVGQCVRCKKTVYCRDGFLDGVVSAAKDLYCHACYDEQVDQAGEQTPGNGENGTGDAG